MATASIPSADALDSDTLYEVVNGEIVEIEPMGAYATWIASLLLQNLAGQQSRGRAVMEMLFDFTKSTGKSDGLIWRLYRLIAGPAKKQFLFRKVGKSCQISPWKSLARPIRRTKSLTKSWNTFRPVLSACGSSIQCRNKCTFTNPRPMCPCSLAMMN
jgi:hypothetical protein